MELVSESLGTVKGTDETELQVDKTFLTTSPYLLDSLLIVGGNVNNEAKFHHDMRYFIDVAYKHYKPIGVVTNLHSYIQASQANNMAGVVFAANNPNFANEFVNAVAKQRFWDRR